MKVFWQTMILVFCSVVLLAQGPATLFTLKKPSDTGVDFNNLVEDEKDHNILIYSNYYGGGGVGVGDFNQDGLPDLYFAGNLVADQLYMNQGNMKFTKQTEAAGIQDNGGWSSGVLVADVNGDHWPDIYVTRELYDNQPDLRKNKLYINQKDGTFKEQSAIYGLDDDGRTRHATFLDYDRDGDLDLFLLNQPPNPGNYSELFGEDLKKEEYAMRLYRNDGTQFVDVSKVAGVHRTAYPNSVTASDLNNDGWTDLFIANDYEAPDFLLINQKDGTFKEEIKEATRHISFYSMGVDAADINNDGWLDVMVLDMVAEDNFRLKANMSAMNPASFWKVVADGGHYQYMFNSLHLNQGVDQNGQLILSDIAQMANVPSTDWSWSNLFADLDNDGYKDIYITNGLLRDIRNSDASKSFPKYVEKTINEWVAKNPNAGDVSIWDILDLDEAMKQIPSEKLKNYVFQNNGDLTFTKKMEDWGLNQASFSNGSAYADLDLDGDLDLVVNNINEPAYIYQNNAQQKGGNNYLRVALKNTKDASTLLGARVKIKYGEQSQWQELTNVRGMYSTSEQTVHFGLKSATKVDELMVTWPDQSETKLKNIKPNQLLSIDFAEAKRAPKTKETERDFLFANADLNLDFKHQENNFDDYAKQVLLPHRMSAFGPAMAAGDINGDGLEDLYFGGAVGQAGAIYLQTADAQFTSTKTPVFDQDKLQEDMDAALIDFDQDGDLDLYVVSGGNAFPQQNKQYQDRLYLNDGKGQFKKSQDVLPRFRDSGGCVRPFDYDSDGDLDLFVGGRHVPWDYPSPAVSRLLRNDNGRFTDVTKTEGRDFISLGLVTDATWTDYDQDGQTDLVVVGEWMPITFFKNTNGKFTKEQTAFPNSTGWWYSIISEDMDGDGDEDLVAGNLGLNYKYKATEKEPFEVHYTDFDQNGSRDIVLSYYNFGKQYPLRGRSCSSEQVPIITKKFESYNLFADATLDEVYSPNKLDEALNYEAYTFASMYLENKGNGVYEPQALPSEAQVSATNSIIAKDLDGDGLKDLLMAGNLYSSEIETTRNDAGVGLFMKGDGAGQFTVISAAESGLYLPFDTKHLQILRNRDQTFLVAAVNNGAPQAFSIKRTAMASKNKNRSGSK